MSIEKLRIEGVGLHPIRVIFVLLITAVFLFVNSKSIYYDSYVFERQEIYFSDGEYIGRLIISKINVDLPILEGASEENLKHSAGHIKYTCFPGEDGNCFIAAHRSWTPGKLFNKLDELEAGDTVTIITGYGEYKYIVSYKYVVEPENTNVFLMDEYDLTLVTCTPLYKASHRLLVFCTLL